MKNKSLVTFLLGLITPEVMGGPVAREQRDFVSFCKP
jgi:hypothetical protein